mgnify:CR=1 FL=1
MKKCLVILIFLLCTAFVGRAQSVNYTTDRTRHDFGELVAGKTYTTTFTVTSTGASPLVLINAQTGCKCTKATFPKKPLQKGEKTTVTVTFDAAEPGFFDKQILVRTNMTKKLAFRITGTVKKAGESML